MEGQMFLERVRSEGLGHNSYILGHGGKAAVIDPRRDCGIYLEIAYRHGAAITAIFETHRNEDYVIGSQELARLAGAQVYHGSRLDFRYGITVDQGDMFDLGDLRLVVLETPGHTFESISIAVKDSKFGKEAVAVFSGDTLFIGDVGRTDFFPENAEEMAGMLYDSIFEKLLPLGDHVILYPGHGAGSVCGKGMAARDFSTLGYERGFNPVLQIGSRKEFIRYKVQEHHYKPPYFRMMEKLNLEGIAPATSGIAGPRPLGAGEFVKAIENGALILDTRSPEAFAGAFIPGSTSIPLDMIPAFAGYFLPYDRKIVLVVQNYEDVATAVLYLRRLGYDYIQGYIAGGLRVWESSGRSYDRIPAVHIDELVRRIQLGDDFTLLDVRGIDEVRQGRLPGSVHIYLGELRQRLDEIPRDRPVTTYCENGSRGVIAASILKQSGFEAVEDSLGSMAACMALGCPIIRD